MRLIVLIALPMPQIASTAFPGTLVDPSSRRLISPMDWESYSAAAATACTLAVTCSEAAATDVARPAEFCATVCRVSAVDFSAAAASETPSITPLGLSVTSAASAGSRRAFEPSTTSPH